jgi:hypothetical protein
MATVTGLTAAASMMPVAVVTGGEARPSTPGKVWWIGGTTRPTFMAEGDVWLRIQSNEATIPEFVTTVLNTITQNVAFSQGLVINGTSPFTFTITAGALPTGLSIHSVTGLISGTPTVSGTYSFTVQVTNAVGSSSHPFTGSVSSTAVAPDITTTALNTLTQGTAFSQTLNASGTTPMTWTISSGTFPSGLTLNSANGSITGTPTGSGVYSFAVQATNTAGNDTQAYTGTIGATGSAPVITTTTLNALQAGFSFSQTLGRTGSTPMTWGISAGTIPAGLTINSSTGALSGTPSAAGAYSFTVQATNSFGSDTQAYTGTVAAGSGANVFSIFGSATPPLTLTSFSDASAGSWVSQQYYSIAGTPLTSGSKIIGVRLYVPTGSAHIGQFWYGALIRNTTAGFYPGIGTLPHTQFDSNGTKKTGSVLVAGWNELLFDVEQDIVPAGSGSWVVGVQIGDGTKYLHDSTFTINATQNPDGKNFYLAESSGSGIKRAFYNNTDSSARCYGIDVLMRVLP